MADLVHIRVVFKAGPGQDKNPTAEYEISPDELKKLAGDLKSPNSYVGSYQVRRSAGISGGMVDTTLIVRFSEVLYIG